MKHGSNFSCMCVVSVVSTALQLSEMCDGEEWLYPLPAKMVPVSCLPQGRQLRIVKHYSLLPGGRPTACMCWGAWRKKLSPGLQGFSPRWLGALMCPFDVSALRRLERIIKSSLNSSGWSWGRGRAAPVGLHIPEVDTFTEVGLLSADGISKAPQASQASAELHCLGGPFGRTLLSGTWVICYLV